MTPEALVAVSVALRSAHPVWLAGGPGAGAYEIARALHRAGDPAGFVSIRRPLASAAEVDERLRSAVDDDPGGDAIGLYVERIERQSGAVQECMLRYGDEGVRSRGRTTLVRLLAQSDEGCRASELMPALRDRLSALVVPLPPLDARRGDIAAIARALADQLSAELGLPEPVIEDAALRRLAERGWPRNLDELAAVVTRGLLAAQGRPIDDFDAPQPSRPGASPPPPTFTSPGERSGNRAALEPREIELVVAELAHELKNPMVTIKTFAENLDQMVADASLREKFVALTREAVDRMDGFLEELLRFSRFAEPRPQNFSVAGALTRAIEANAARVRERVRCNGVPGELRLRADEEQFDFALRSLLRGLSRETSEDAPIQVEVSPGGALVFHSTVVNGPQRKLQKALDHQANGRSPISIDFLMADALIRRNGGSSEILRGRDQLHVRLNLPNLERVANV